MVAAVGAATVALMADPAFAQPADVAASTSGVAEPAPAIVLGYGALPGGLHVAGGETLPAGTFAFSALGGFGQRSGLLGANTTLDRVVGDLAFAYAPVAQVAIGVSFDGRYDKHTGNEDGLVGDPHVLVRAGTAMGKNHFGAQLGVWLPGKDAPSVAFGATSLDLRGVASFAAGPATISVNAGFRLDNSAKSVDNRDSLSIQDRVSLGVSDFHAAVGGAHVLIPAGNAFVAFEGSVDAFIGDGAPGPIIRGGGRAGLKIGDALALLAFVEVAKVPGISETELMSGTFKLIPWEPTFTGGLSLQGHFGGPKKQADTNPNVVVNKKPEPVEVDVMADVTGTVVDENGKPVVGAQVTVRLKKHTGTEVTDAKGAYTVSKLPIGKKVDDKTSLDDAGAEVSVAVDKKKPNAKTLTLVAGVNKMDTITLEPVLPPGQLKAIVRAAATGKPIANATVTIEPGGATATSGADGSISIDLPPGQYKAKATAAGFKDQTLEVSIEEGGVRVKNFELPK
jgi:carboxypeptidase family protein